jgi:hypothetical protein
MLFPPNCKEHANIPIHNSTTRMRITLNPKPAQFTQFNFITLTSINKKGYDFEQLVGNTCIKRNYFLTHKSMVKPIKKPSQMFFISINQLTSFIIDLKQSKTQEDILMYKQLDDCM